MKIAMIHDGIGVDIKAKVAVNSEIKRYAEKSNISIRTVRIDFLPQLYKELSESGEKIQLIFFIGIPLGQIIAAKQKMPPVKYPLYFVRVGNHIQTHEVHESVPLITNWKAKGFLEFINVVHS